MRHVHLVGSVPLSDARAVFETVSAVLGRKLKRIPDGETGGTFRLDYLAGAGIRRKSGAGKIRRIVSDPRDRYSAHPLSAQARQDRKGCFIWQPILRR